MLRLPHRVSLCLPVAALVLASALYSAPAAACGGCFVPPPIPSRPETSTVVTDHRMVLSVGQGQSTLYDQIRYQGAPEAFAWVLPITGEAQVGWEPLFHVGHLFLMISRHFTSRRAGRVFGMAPRYCDS
jgi:hypothetical protein